MTEPATAPGGVMQILTCGRKIIIRGKRRRNGAPEKDTTVHTLPMHKQSKAVQAALLPVFDLLNAGPRLVRELTAAQQLLE